MIITTVYSIITGSISGLLYGLFFALQRRRVLALNSTSGRFAALTTAVMTCVRLMLLLAFWYYLLLTIPINPILLIISFLGTFWLVILK